MRYILEISYIGKNYSGYQRQKDKVTIQSKLEDALGQVLQQDISIVASGRTDAGVSAIRQICHFDVDSEINCGRIISYTNHLLPKDIQVLDIHKIDDDFHARFSSKRKTYEYYFYIGQTIPVYEQFATNIGYNIDIDSMIEASRIFEGTMDFSAFCASNTEVKDKVRTIYQSEIIQLDDNLFKFVITGNGFLYNMVRIIMGTLVAIGRKKINKANLPSIIQSRDRNNSGKTMPSKGLFLKKVEY